MPEEEPSAQPNMAESMKIDWVEIDGRQKVVLQFANYPLQLKNWVQTIPLTKDNSQYKIIANSVEQAHPNYLHAPYQHAYIADVEVVDGDATLGPTEVGEEEQEAAKMREVLSDEE